MASYAAAGLLQNLGNRLAPISQALMGIRQRDEQEAEMARQAEMDQQNAEFRSLQTEALRRDLNAPAEDPTRYATHSGRTYDLRDPSQMKAYGTATAPRPDAIEWDTRETDQGLVQVHPVTGETRPLGLRGPAKADGGQYNKVPRTIGDREYVFDPRAGTYTPAELPGGGGGVAGGGAGPTGGGIAGIDDLPATAQSAVAGASPALETIDRYRKASADYLSVPGARRLMGVAGLSAGVQDRQIGELRAMQQAVLINVKNLAELGALSGPDQQIVMDMIGDPTGFGAVRNPERVLASIDEARRFLEGKIAGLEGAYGVSVPRPVQPPTQRQYSPDNPYAKAGTQ